MPDSPLISVIVPVYNVEKYLRKCLDSICGQTYHHLEILCINDGSTDGSAAILEEYAAKDTRIKVFTQQNAGLSAARNTGLSHAAGEWITGVDSDDYLEEDAIKAALENAEDNVDIVDFGVRVIWEDMDEEPDVARNFAPCLRGLYSPTIELLLKATVIFPGKLWRSSFIRQFRTLFPVGLWYEDNYFWWALAPFAKNIQFLGTQKYCYIRHGGSIMSQTYQGTARRLELITIADKLQEHYNHFPLPPQLAYARIASFLYLYQGASNNLLPELRPRLKQEAQAVASKHKLFDIKPRHLQFLQRTPWYKRPFVRHKTGKSTYGLCGIPFVVVQTKLGVEITRFFGIKIRKKTL